MNYIIHCPKCNNSITFDEIDLWRHGFKGREKGSILKDSECIYCKIHNLPKQRLMIKEIIPTNDQIKNEVILRFAHLHSTLSKILPSLCLDELEDNPLEFSNSLDEALLDHIPKSFRTLLNSLESFISLLYKDQIELKDPLALLSQLNLIKKLVESPLKVGGKRNGKN